jgi:HPt (histidine-containing phosphotransfer) domain-containing protein
MNDHVAKPIDPSVLLTVLSRWLPCSHKEVPPKKTVSAPEFPDKLPGIDLSAALARLSGNRELLLKLLRNFRMEWSGSPETVRNAVATGDLPKALHTAHTLRGVAGNLAMSAVAGAAEELERAVQREERENVPSCLKKLENALTPVLAGLERLPPMLPLPVTAAPVNRAALARQFSELASLLRQSDLRAEESFTGLRTHLGAGEWSEAMERLEQQMDRLDFTAAGRTLAELAEILGIEAVRNP